MKFIKTLSLKYIMLFTVLLGLFIPAWVSYEYEKQEVTVKLEAELLAAQTKYSRLLLEIMRDPIWQLDKAFAEVLLSSLMVDDKLSYISVELPNGRSFIEAGKPRRDNVVPRLINRLTFEDKLIGIIIVEVNRDKMMSTLHEIKQRFLYKIVVTEVASTLLIFFILYFRFTIPLAKLVTQAKQLASGEDVDVSVWHRNDELGLLGHSLDDTKQELQIMIKKIATHSAELEDTILLRTNELKMAMLEVTRTEKLAALGSLVAGIAHELNTPLGSTLTIISTMQESLTKFNTALSSGGITKQQLTDFIAEQQEGINITLRSLHHAIDLVMSFKQVSVDQTSDKRREFVFDTLVNDILLTIKPILKKTKHTIKLDIDKQLKFDSYPGALGQVLTNLINNAVIHAFDPADAGVITIKASKKADSLVLSVADNGIGVAENIMPRLFDPFFTTKLGQGGSGLGLNIVYTLVTNVLHGTVTANNRPAPKHGLVVELVIPLKP